MIYWKIDDGNLKLYWGDFDEKADEIVEGPITWTGEHPTKIIQRVIPEEHLTELLTGKIERAGGRKE